MMFLKVAWNFGSVCVNAGIMNGLADIRVTATFPFEINEIVPPFSNTVGTLYDLLRASRNIAGPITTDFVEGS